MAKNRKFKVPGDLFNLTANKSEEITFLLKKHSTSIIEIKNYLDKM